MKKLLYTKTTTARHWVGDGFPVRTIFSYNDFSTEVSPFLLMDYAGPAEFSPSSHIRGVGEHPHRGFETVTLVYSGQVEHRDSAGGGGLIGPGDVQWMTAASGLVHDEMHGKEFAKNGGLFEMIQLWVNLPKKDKMTNPRYQTLLKRDIGEVTLPEQGGTLRVIAGEFGGNKGPAKTYTPINLWDLSLKSGRTVDLTMPEGFATSFFVLRGRVELGTGEQLGEAELGVLSRGDEAFSLKAFDDALVLVLGGEVINEPIVGHGPFVMNSEAEILDAIQDFQAGRMGKIGVNRDRVRPT